MMHDAPSRWRALTLPRDGNVHDHRSVLPPGCLVYNCTVVHAHVLGVVRSWRQEQVFGLLSLRLPVRMRAR